MASSSHPAHRGLFSNRWIWALAGIPFFGLCLWSMFLVSRTKTVQVEFDQRSAQAVQLTRLLDSLARLHQTGSEVLQSYAVGYQRLVFEKSLADYAEARRAVKVWPDTVCSACAKKLDAAVDAYVGQTRHVWAAGERWEALPAGPKKSEAMRQVSDRLFQLNQRNQGILTAFRELESANRERLDAALRAHARNARHVYSFAAVTLLMAVSLLFLAFLAMVQTRRSRLAERLTRALMDVVPDGILVWREDGRIQKANPSACALLACPEADLIGQAVQRWLPPEAHACLEDAQSSIGVQFSLHRPSESALPLEGSAGCILTREGVKHVGIFRDLSQRLEVERQVREAQKMEAVGLLAAGVVHDVKNLLTPMVMAEEMLSEEPELSPHGAKLLHQIRKGAETATGLVNQLLHFVRREEPELAEGTDPIACVQETLRLMHYSLGPGIRIQTRLDPNPCLVGASYTELVQIFTNLFVNAQHAMHGHGTLTVEAAVDGSSVEIHVSDTGHGMSPEVQARIFDPLYTTKGKEGNGLGLYNVKLTLAKIGGTISVDSTPGVGSSFALHLPASLKSIE